MKSSWHPRRQQRWQRSCPSSESRVDSERVLFHGSPPAPPPASSKSDGLPLAPPSPLLLHTARRARSSPPTLRLCLALTYRPFFPTISPAQLGLCAALLSTREHIDLAYLYSATAMSARKKVLLKVEPRYTSALPTGL